MFLLNRLTALFITQVRTLESKRVKMPLIITWITADGSQRYAKQTRTRASRQSLKMYRQVQSVPWPMPSCLSNSHCVPCSQTRGRSEGCRGQWKACMLSRTRVTTYIFVAIFVLVIMLVAVPAKEKMLRQDQRGHVYRKAIAAVCMSSPMAAKMRGQHR